MRVEDEKRRNEFFTKQEETNHSRRLSEHCEETRERSRSLTPFVLRSQGKSDGISLQFNSRLSPSPKRSFQRKRKKIRRRTSLEFSSEMEDPIVKRNMSSEIQLMGEEDQGETENKHKINYIDNCTGEKRRSEWNINGKEEEEKKYALKDIDKCIGENGRSEWQLNSMESHIRIEETGGFGCYLKKKEFFSHRMSMERSFVNNRGEEGSEKTVSRISKDTLASDLFSKKSFPTIFSNTLNFPLTSHIINSSPLKQFGGMDLKDSSRTGFTYINSLVYKDQVTPGRLPLSQKITENEEYHNVYKTQKQKESSEFSEDDDLSPTFRPQHTFHNIEYSPKNYDYLNLIITTLFSLMLIPALCWILYRTSVDREELDINNIS